MCPAIEINQFAVLCLQGRHKDASQLRAGARLCSRIDVRFRNDRPKWATKSATLPLNGYRFAGLLSHVQLECPAHE